MRIGVAALTALALLLGGCGGDTKEAAPPPPAKPQKAAPAARVEKPAAAGTYVKVRKTRYGRILTDGKGRALYLFTKERGSRAACYGACANAWPPFYAKGRVKAGQGVSWSRVGTTARRAGRSQVTYRGHPLYYYVTDRAPGQVTCQNVAEYGGTWLVVAPTGNAIR